MQFADETHRFANVPFASIISIGCKCTLHVVRYPRVMCAMCIVKDLCGSKCRQCWCSQQQYNCACLLQLNCRLDVHDNKRKTRRERERERANGERAGDEEKQTKNERKREWRRQTHWISSWRHTDTGNLYCIVRECRQMYQRMNEQTSGSTSRTTGNRFDLDHVSPIEYYCELHVTMCACMSATFIPANCNGVHLFVFIPFFRRNFTPSMLNGGAI